MQQVVCVLFSAHYPYITVTSNWSATSFAFSVYHALSLTSWTSRKHCAYWYSTVSSSVSKTSCPGHVQVTVQMIRGLGPFLCLMPGTLRAFVTTLNATDGNSVPQV